MNIIGYIAGRISHLWREMWVDYFDGYRRGQNRIVK